MRLVRIWRNLRHRRRLDRDLDDELRSAIDLLARAHIARGAPVDEARRRALLETGSLAALKDRVRDERDGAFLESVAADVRYAIRGLWRQPGFTAAALLTLGLGIGLNTSLATAFMTMLFRPWPVRVADRLTQVDVVRRGDGDAPFSWQEFRHLADHARDSAIIATGCGMDGRMQSCKFDVGHGQTVIGQFVSGNYFRLLEIPIARGRGIADADDRLEAPSTVAVISHGLWQQVFNGDLDVVGQTIDLDGMPFAVIGVADPAFTGTSLLRRDVWVPLASASVARPSRRSTMVELELVALVAPGVARDTAAAELNVLLARRSPSPAQVRLVDTSFFSRSRDREESMVFFAIAFSALLLVLLVACANVGNLLLARSAARRREIAIRASIGAGRRRLIRQFLTESFVLAAVAAAIGLWLALVLPTWFLDYAFARADVAGPLALEIRPDWRIAVFSAGLAILTCVAFGLAPALHASRVDVVNPLKDQPGTVRLSLRSWLLGVQVAVSVILLATAGLLVRGLERAYTMDRGFETQGVSMIAFDLPASFAVERRRAFESDMIGAVRPLDARTDVAIATAAPFDGWVTYTSVKDGRRPESKGAGIALPEVSAGYFAVLGIRLQAGRLLSAADAKQHRLVINESLARRLFRDRNPVGETLLVAGAAQTPVPHEIVGVVTTADHGEGAEPAAYEGLGDRSEWLWATGNDRQRPPRLIFRNPGSGAARALAETARRFEPQVRIVETSLAAAVAARYSEERFSVGLAATVGGLALALATVGVFGVFAYTVRQQTREIGVRLALGARAREVVTAIVAPSLRPLAAGLVAGVVTASILGNLLRSSLYGLSPYDPFAHVTVIAVVLIAALIALALPAWRATRIDPTVALKSE
jgi:predicted permease